MKTKLFLQHHASEAVWIVEKGRTSIPAAKNVISAVEADPGVVIYQLDKDVIEMTMSLSAINEMHSGANCCNCASFSKQR